MDAKYFAEIKAREQAATSGKWEICDVPGDVTFVFSPAEGEPDICYRCSYPDANFIAHARTDIPALIAEVERLTTENADVKARLDRFIEAGLSARKENATLKKALELAVEESYGKPAPQEIIDEIMQQAQEQEGKK